MSAFINGKPKLQQGLWSRLKPRAHDFGEGVTQVVFLSLHVPLLIFKERTVKGKHKILMQFTYLKVALDANF